MKDSPAEQRRKRDAEKDFILKQLDPNDLTRGHEHYIPGLLYVVNPLNWNGTRWYRWVIEKAQEFGFTALAAQEVAPLISLSELNVWHLLLARADAILFEATVPKKWDTMDPRVAYQLGYSFAIGNVSTDVIVMMNSDESDALVKLCPYEITAYKDKTFLETLKSELGRLQRLRPHLKYDQIERDADPLAGISSVRRIR